MGASGKGEGPEVAQMELEVEEGGGGEEPASQPFASQQHVISAELLQAVLAAKSDVAGVAILADNLVGSEWDHSDIARSRGMIAAEFAYLNIAFAKEKGFTSDQALAFVSIMQEIFQKGIMGRVDGHMVTMEESYDDFKAQMLARSVAQGDGPTTLFEVSTVSKIVEFVTRTFYRHFKAYALCWGREQPSKQLKTILQVQTPMKPRPLSEAKAVA